LQTMVFVVASFLSQCFLFLFFLNSVFPPCLSPTAVNPLVYSQKETEEVLEKETVGPRERISDMPTYRYSICMYATRVVI